MFGACAGSQPGTSVGDAWNKFGQMVSSAEAMFSCLFILVFGAVALCGTESGQSSNPRLKYLYSLFTRVHALVVLMDVSRHDACVARSTMGAPPFASPSAPNGTGISCAVIPT